MLQRDLVARGLGLYSKSGNGEQGTGNAAFLDRQVQWNLRRSRGASVMPRFGVDAARMFPCPRFLLSKSGNGEQGTGNATFRVRWVQRNIKRS